ncbi:MAG: hypothetical protein ACYC2O_12025 [Microthrixaceae bacterium]
MSKTTNTATARSTRLTVARRAGLFLVGTAGALTLTGTLAGTASAFTPPAPKPVLPIAQPGEEPQPPVGPMVIAFPEQPDPGFDGPDQVAQPLPTPDPHPAPTPQGPSDLAAAPVDPGFPGPDDFTNGEDDPGLPGPDDFTNGEDDPGFDGPDDFTNGEDEPGLDGPDDFTNGDGDPVDPEPQPQDEDGAVEAEVESSTEEAALAEEQAAASLAFTGGEMTGLTIGLGLLGAGAAAAGGTAIARRRRAAEQA